MLQGGFEIKQTHDLFMPDFNLNYRENLSNIGLSEEQVYSSAPLFDN